MGNHIVLNGAIREVEEISLLIEFLVSEIIETADCNIGSLIISTWQSDALRNHEFVEWAKKLGVTLILSSDINYGGPANYMRQMVTLDAALETLPLDDFVFKSRTDKSLQRKDALKSFITKSSNELAFASLKDKIAIEHFSKTVPFMAKDMNLLSSVGALRELVTYSERTRYRNEYIYNAMGPEVFMWLELERRNPMVSAILQQVDLRLISNDLCRTETQEEMVAYFAANPKVRDLFTAWLETIDRRLVFFSEILEVDEVHAWQVDEGNWSYKIGDRSDLDQLKSALLLSEKSASKAKLREAGSNTLFELRSNPFSTFPESVHSRILNSLEPEDSNIVLLRRTVIKDYLLGLSEFNNIEFFKKALISNIQHRDPEAHDLVLGWLLEDSHYLTFLSNEILAFVLETKIEQAYLIADWKARANLLTLAKRHKLKSAKISLFEAESSYARRRPFLALMQFIRAYALDSNSLGVNHGLGSVLLDFRLTRLARKYLLAAHRLSPQDQTAAWTLMRCEVKLGNMESATVLTSLMSGERKSWARAIIESR